MKKRDEKRQLRRDGDKRRKLNIGDKSRTERKRRQ